MDGFRHYSLVDRLCLSVDQAVRALTNNVKTSGQVYPANDVEESLLNTEDRQHAASLMRVNHTGEICAQALYHGQGIVSKESEIQKKNAASCDGRR